MREPVLCPPAAPSPPSPPPTPSPPPPPPPPPIVIDIIPDSCTKKLEYLRALNPLDEEGNPIEAMLNVPARAGKKGGNMCPRGKCCTTMPNANEFRCNLAVRDMTTATTGQMHICHWDADSSTCTSKFVKSGKTDDCQTVIRMLKNIA